MSARHPYLYTEFTPPQDHDGSLSALDTGLPTRHLPAGVEQPAVTFTTPQDSPPIAAFSKNNGMFDQQPEDFWHCAALCTCGGKLGFNLHERRAMPTSHTLASHTLTASGETAFVDNVAINFVVLSLRGGHLTVLSHQRPQAKGWVLPGGLLHADRSLSQSACKHLENLTASDKVYHEQLQVIDGREPDTGLGVLNIVYYALLKPEQYQRNLDNPHCELQWHSIDDALSMMAGQEDILHFALQSLRRTARFEPIAFHLLPEQFTLSNLQEAYEAILDVQFRKSNFRRKIAKVPFLIRCQERQKDVAHRAAELYRFDETAYHEACNSGYVFPI